MKPLAACRLYAFIDTAYLQGRSPEMVAELLCQGGADIVQVRAKTESSKDLLRMAKRIIPITRAHGVNLVINDDILVAREIGAEFCHLGQEDFFGAGHSAVAALKEKHGLAGIGLSTHGPEQANRSIKAGADYVAIGPVYRTPTKPSANPVTLEYVSWAAANVKIPWFAIGGIHLENLNDVLAAGARRICVVSAILKATDIVGACREFKRRIVNWPG